MAAETFDLVILGAGPAGLSASIYAARAGLRCVVFSSGPIGGELPEISHISNYPGFVGSGADLAEAMKKQAEAAGARIVYGKCSALRQAEAAGGLSSEGSGSAKGFCLMIDEEEINARAVLVATGSEPKTLEFEVEKPVSYCALCDGDLVKGKSIAVVGGANSALQEALYLADLAGEVTVISHSPLKAEQFLRQKAAGITNIKIMENIEVTAELLNQFDHIFVYVGKRPASCFLNGIETSIVNEQGYIVTGTGGRAHETALLGLFAAGDVRAGAVRQVITAAGDGAAAATEIIDFMK